MGFEPSQTLPNIIRYSDSRPIYEPTTSADVVTVASLPRALSAATASVQLEGASVTPYASMRMKSGCLSIRKLTCNY